MNGPCGDVHGEMARRYLISAIPFSTDPMCITLAFRTCFRTKLLPHSLCRHGVPTTPVEATGRTQGQAAGWPISVH